MKEIQCPLPFSPGDIIQLAHGGGGRLTHQLIAEMFYPAFSNPMLDEQHDGAVFECKQGKMAYTTDSFVVDPIFFNGGDIGDLAINGTVNDLTCCGATPLFLTAAFIIEEGFPMGDLQRVVNSMKRAADKAGVSIVTGDTKVVDKGKCDKIFINTSGIGVVPERIRIHADRIEEGDAVIVTGKIGQHGICILSTRENLGFETDVASDTASLNHMVKALTDAVPVHFMRDPTRGGLSSTLNEIAETGNLLIELEEEQLPIGEGVRSACELLGLDPLLIANEGIILIFVREKDVEPALDILHGFPEGSEARVIGSVVKKQPVGEVVLNTEYGGQRIIEMLRGEQLPRIC